MVAAHPLGGAVGRAVVENQHLPGEAGVVLLAQGGEAGLQMLPAVPGEDGDRNLRGFPRSWRSPHSPRSRSRHTFSRSSLSRRRTRKASRSGGATVAGRWAKRSLAGSTRGSRQKRTRGARARSQVKPERSSRAPSRRSVAAGGSGWSGFRTVQGFDERPRQGRGVARRHHPAGVVLGEEPAHGPPLARHHRAAGGQGIQEAGAEREPGFEARPVRGDQEVDVPQQVVAALGRDPVENLHPAPPPAEPPAAGLDLGEEPLRGGAGIGVADQEEGPGAAGKLLAPEGVQEGPGVVPVVEPAEEEPALPRPARGEDRPVGRQRLGHPEGDRGDQGGEVGVVRDPLRVDPAEGGEEAEVEGPLLLGRAEKEVAAGELQDPGGVVVSVGVEPEGLEVGEVLDQPGVVEVDRHRETGEL